MDYYTYNQINTLNNRSSSFSSASSFSTSNSIFSNNSCGSNNIQQITELNNYYNSTINNKPTNQIYQYYNNGTEPSNNNNYNQLTKENLLLNEYQKQLQTIQLQNSSNGSSNSLLSQQQNQQNLQNQQHNHSQQQQKLNAKGQDTNRKLFKTELCTKYVLSNECPYNEKCQFAHGLKELQTRQVNPKFKSKMCKNYNKTGYCRYGDRCQFKHGENSNNSNRHLYIKKNDTEVENNSNSINNNSVSNSGNFVSNNASSSSVPVNNAPNDQWVANVKFIGKVNNW